MSIDSLILNVGKCSFFETLKCSFPTQEGGKIFTMFFSKDIFVTILEFEKLERLEFGGTKGAILNGQIHEMSEEFMELCKIFKQSTYDPSDYNNMVILYLFVFNFIESYFKAGKDSRSQ